MFLPDAMRHPPRLDDDLRTTPPSPRHALLINPFYPKDPHASFGKHVLTPSLALTSIAASTPEPWTVEYWDENLLAGPPPSDPLPAVVGITVHLTFAERAYELAAWYRARGAKVILGALHALSCPDEVAPHADAIALGEGVAIWGDALRDFERGELRKTYRGDYRRPPHAVPHARRLEDRRRVSRGRSALRRLHRQQPRLATRIPARALSRLATSREDLERGGLDRRDGRSESRPRDGPRRVHGRLRRIRVSLRPEYRRRRQEEPSREGLRRTSRASPRLRHPGQRQLRARVRPRHRPRRLSAEEELASGYEQCYRRLFSHRSIWRRRPSDWSAVPAYLAMSYLYKRSNRFWHMLIRRRLTARVWRPLVELTRRRHVGFRARIAEIDAPAAERRADALISAGVQPATAFPICPTRPTGTAPR